ncbi:MAG: peptidase, partial [Pseudomonadota bacterium]
MNLATLRFELSYHFSRPTFWLLCAFFFFIAAIDLIAKGSEGAAFFFVNSPYEIYQATIWYSIFAVLVAAAFVADTFVRDSRTGMSDLLLATPVRKIDYLLTRFIGAYVAALLCFSAYLPGMVAGALFPGLNEFAIGPIRLAALFGSFIGVAVPNLMLVSVFCFIVGVFSQRLMTIFAASLILVMCYVASLIVVGGEVVTSSNASLWALGDPFGFNAFETRTSGWSVYEHNTRLPHLGGLFATNRVVWLAIAALAFLFAYLYYPMRRPTAQGSRRPLGAATQNDETATIQHVETANVWSQTTYLNTLRVSLTREFFALAKSRAFALLTLGGAFVLVVAGFSGATYDYSGPTTDVLIDAAAGYFDVVMLACVIIFAADAIWRERDYHFQAIIDASNVPDSILLLGKLFALWAMVTLQLLFAGVVLLSCQLVQGHTTLEIKLYLLSLFGLIGPYLYLTAALSLVLQAVISQRYVAMAATLLVCLSPLILDAFGVHHNLLRWARFNDIEYSPMNGYGHLLTGHWWFVAYWSAVASGVLLIGLRVWPRGARRGSGKHAVRWAPRFVAIGALIFALVAIILRNTAWLNPVNPPGKRHIAAEIERRYSQYAALPMPVVTHTELKVELFPETRRLRVDGKYQLENRHAEPISELHLLTFINLELQEVNFSGAKLQHADRDNGYFIYRLETPLQAGQSETLEFTTTVETPSGFRNLNHSSEAPMVYPNEVVDNGTNLYSGFITPFIGYTRIVEHQQAWLRARLGLPAAESKLMASDDPLSRQRAWLIPQGVWGSTDITVGVPQELLAVTDGRIAKRWRQDGREYTQFLSEKFERGEYIIHAGRYDVYRHTNSKIPIEIYYHPEHQENVALIAEFAQQTLNHFETIFGPYPFERLRIVESVYYDGVVGADGDTLSIPEVLVWKNIETEAGRENAAHWLAYLVAQAWWEASLIPADAAGSAVFREGLSEYASQHFLSSIRTNRRQSDAQRHRLRELFRELGKLDVQEPPLSLAYNQLGVARHKGSLVFGLVADLVGEDLFHQSLRRFLASYQNAPPPYPTLQDLRAQIVSDAPEYDKAVSQLFDQVSTFNLGITEARIVSRDDELTEVELTLENIRFVGRGLGEKRSTVNELPVTVVLTDDSSGRELYRQKHHFDSKNPRLKLRVAGVPTR